MGSVDNTKGLDSDEKCKHYSLFSNHVSCLIQVMLLKSQTGLLLNTDTFLTGTVYRRGTKFDC